MGSSWFTKGPTRSGKGDTGTHGGTMLKDSVQEPNLSSMMLTNPLLGFLVPRSGGIFIYHFVMKVSGVFLSVVLSILIHIPKKGPF